MKFVITSALSLFTSCLFAQLPDSDIWLLDIRDSAGKISFHAAENITNRKGYDNQPAFSPDARLNDGVGQGKYILYSSQQDSGGATDIYQYDIKTKQIIQFTKIPESEYSPTFMPDGKHISAVVVEKDSTQRLWSFDLNPVGKSSDAKSIEMRWPRCIMDKVKEIGYHCWVNKDSVALNVLTKPAFTLQIADIHTQRTFVVADSIGRCMKMKGQKLYFTTSAIAQNNLCVYDFKSKKLSIAGAIESEDFCFYKDEIWSCSGSSILAGFLNSKLGSTEIINLASLGITKITRITVSADGKKLAVVSNK